MDGSYVWLWRVTIANQYVFVSISRDNEMRRLTFQRIAQVCHGEISRVPYMQAAGFKLYQLRVTVNFLELFLSYSCSLL